MPEEVSYKLREMRVLADQAVRQAGQPTRRAESLVMDAARYQDAAKWGDRDLVATRDFGDLYERRLIHLEGEIRGLVRRITDFSDDVKKAAREAGRQDEQVAEDLSSAAHSLANSPTNAYTTQRPSVWEG